MRTRAVLVLLFFFAPSSPSYAWFDETHITIAKMAGYSKWFNAAAADAAKERFWLEGDTHFVNNDRRTETECTSPYENRTISDPALFPGTIL